MKNTIIACLAGSNTCSAVRCGNSAVLGCLQTPAAIRRGEALAGKRACWCSSGKSGEEHALKNYSLRKAICKRRGRRKEEMANREKHPWLGGSIRGPVYRDTCCRGAKAKKEDRLAEFG